jgi:hypothetical protein
MKRNIQELKQTQLQLKIMDEINKICSLHKFKIWLGGSWAVDFISGKVTREHEGIELVTFVRYRETLEEALIYSGYKKGLTNNLGTDFNKNKINIHFIYIDKLKDGNIVANSVPDWVWEKDSLQTEYYHIEGVSMNVLHPRQLLQGKIMYEKYTHRKLREEDMESIKFLEGLIKSMS